MPQTNFGWTRAGARDEGFVTMERFDAKHRWPVSIATAATLLSAIAFCGPAKAGPVEIYGIVDVGVVFEGGNAAGSITKVTSGVESGSRIGFRGREDLGDGLSAYFVLESGFSADTGAGAQG